MNQILMVENKKKAKTKKSKGPSQPVGIKNIVRFFAVAIIIFALCIIGHSSYALYRDAKGNNTEDLPIVSMTRVNDTLVVDVQSVNQIDRFRYSWSNSEEMSITEEATNFQETIILPSENNTLTIILEDETGRAITYTKEIILDGIDIVKPTINISGEGENVVIVATDDTDLDYITYQIDDGEEIRIDNPEEDERSMQYNVTSMERGEHTIYVTAADKTGNIAEYERTIIVSAKPEITELTIDEETDKLIIGVADMDGVQSLEINLNGQVYTINDINRTEVRYSIDLVDGTNTLNITVTNVNGLSTVGATEFEYAR